MNSIHIEKYKTGQETAISQLIKKVYDEFVSCDYSEAGNRFFYEWIEPEKMAARQIPQINILVAWSDFEMVGMIEIRDNKNISLLFVDKEYHGQGIARKLFHEALKECKIRESEIKMFYVHASPFSIPAYEKLGFIAVAEMQEANGIKYLPMEMNLYENTK